MKRNILSSPRLLEFKRQKRKIFLRKVFLLIFSFIIILGVLSFLSHIDRLNITQVEIEGNKVVDAPMLKTAVEQEIAGNYLWVFPKTNILFYPKNKIKNELLTKFVRMRDVTFSIKNKKVLEVSVTERDPKYLWCGEFANLEDEHQCYFMDETGYIFDEAPYFSGEVYFKFYGKAHAGSYFVSEIFAKLISFQEILQSMGLKPVELQILDNGDVEINLSRSDSTLMKPKIILKINSDFQKMAENLEAALSTEPLLSKFKNKYSSLLYIDLRFGNKVYYKFNE